MFEWGVRVVWVSEWHVCVWLSGCDVCMVEGKGEGKGKVKKGEGEGGCKDI